jgi:antitoxin FitA
VATLTIRDLDDRVKARLRVRAAEHGRSMEAEARAILASALTEQAAESGLGSRIRERFAAIGGADLSLPARSDAPRGPSFPA